MITDTDAGNFVEAPRQGACLRADGLRLRARSANPFLAELAIEVLKATSELVQKVKCISTAIKSA